MRAKTVNERIDFQKGKEPKEALRIGLKGRNSWNQNPPINVLLSSWKAMENPDEEEKEMIQKAAELLRTTPDQLRILIEPLDEWEEEFEEWEDYLNSSKYFGEKNTYLGEEWDFASQEDIEGLYEQEEEILQRVSLEKSNGELRLGESNCVYVAGPHGDLWIMLGTIY